MMPINQPMLKPHHLSPGSTLGLTAASLPLLPSWEADYQTGKQTLQSLGFLLKEGQTIRKRRWWSAGTSEEQANEINNLFADPQIHGIVALAGGFSSIQVIDKLDYDLIRRNPKPFLGMSDITTYQIAMYTLAGLVGFQGNTVIEGFGKDYMAAPPAHRQVISNLYKHLLMTPAPLGRLTALTPWECWRPGRAQGRLFGGVLRRLVGLAGTKYFPALDDFDGAILFWEEIGETLYDITINLTKLKHLGILDRIAGMLVGKLTWINQFFDEIEHPTPREAILDALSGYNFPILAEVDFGHNQTMLPLPIGIQALMDSENKIIEILESATITDL